MHSRKLAGIALGAIVALALPLAAPANAGTGPTTIADGFVSPLGLAVAHDGTALVAESFGGGKLTAVKKGVKKTLVDNGPGLGISGVDTRGPGTTTFVVAGEDDQGNPVQTVNVLGIKGKSRVLADLGAYEAKKNPDRTNRYGFQGLSNRCAAKVGEENSHPGIVDSNPYAVKILPNGDRIVADAGGNTLLRVSPKGKISTLAVLPPRPVTVTKAIAAAQGLPKCTIGHKYNFDFVPTDVELGPDGHLYVTSLPGGPEDDSLGARGAVFKVNPWSGSARLVASGFLGATDLAISPTGKIYVAELFGNRISTVVHGKLKTVAELPNPAAVEYSRGSLYVTTNVFVNGTLVRVKL